MCRRTTIVTVDLHQPARGEVKTEQHCALHMSADRTAVCHQLTSSQPSGPPSSRACIPANHPLKIVWDVLTILLSLTAGVYTTHAGMRDQCFPHLLNNNCAAAKGALPLFFGYIPSNAVVTFLDLWCVADIVLNFLTEKNVSTTTGLKNAKHGYLKTWFLVDVVCMLSWEVIFVQPIFNKLRKKNIIKKVIGLTRMWPLLKKRWPQLLKICRAAKSVGCGPKRLIRYAPKYIVFTGKMKVVIFLRIMRHMRLQRRLFKNLVSHFFSAPPTQGMTVYQIKNTAAPAA